MIANIGKWLSHPGPGRDLLVAAAVQERCVPTTLLETWVASNRSASKDDVLAAMDAMIDLEALGTPALAADGSDAIALPRPTRLAILREAGADVAQRSLREQGASTLTEASFEALLEARPVDLEPASRQELQALGEAAVWAHALGRGQAVDVGQIRAELLRRDFLDALGGDELPRFVGRERFLATLTIQWRLRPEQREAVLIEGPGGMGKSLTVARFIADLLASDDPDERPDAVFLLDFERLDLQRGRIATVFSEMFRQSARWWLPDLSEALVSQAGELDTAALESVGSTARGGEAIRDESEEAGRLVKAFALPGEMPPRFLVFVDTFEEVETFEDSAARSVRRACMLLRGAGADVMEIYASRDFAHPQALALKRRPVFLKLTRMNQCEALTLLRQEAAKIGIALDKRTADAAQRKLGGWPLDLRFAVALMGKTAAAFDPQRWLAELETSPERRQATLYDRVLKRIRDDDVRKLAKPGLLLRRLTAPIIAQVLAGPCGLELGEDEAKRVLGRARGFGQLFFTDPSDPEAVWHRRDVRAMMFDDLRREIDEKVAGAIHRAAAKFYTRGERTNDRAEELYHRLQLGDPVERLDHLWLPEAGPLLKRSLAELPPEGAAWLRGKLGSASLSGVEATVASVRRGDPRMEELRSVARSRLQEGVADIDDIMEAAAVPASVFSPLGDVYAESLVHRGRIDEVIAGADRLRGSRAPIARTVRAGVYACAAAALEGLGRPREAFAMWTAAQRSGRAMAPVERLGPRIGALRAGRRAATMSAAVRARRLASAAKLALEIGHPLGQHRVAARETAAELGELVTNARGTALRVFLVDLIGELCRSDDIFVRAAADPVRRSEIAKRLDLDLYENEQRNLNNVAAKMLYGGRPSFIDGLVTVMREEVDWTLERATRAGAKT